MRTNQSFGIQFIGRRRGKTAESNVYARITVNKKRVEISLKKTVKTKHWDVAKGKLKSHAPDYNEFNMYLEFVQSKFVECYQELQLKRELITADIIKSHFLCENENYHADTGAPLAPSADHVDENGKFVGFISWDLCVQNILEGVVNDNWMLLEINKT